MKKLLLLTLLPLAGFLYSFAGLVQSGEIGSLSSFNDSTIKEVVLLNPRQGFKDLFETPGVDNNLDVKLNAKAISFVDSYVKMQGRRLLNMKSWGKPYFDKMDDILTRYHLPVELKYLSVIESDLKSSAVSWAGAVGPWQFMPETARLMGLRVSKSRDERTDFTKSTKAAARYLTELYGLYNDWLLVIAAYNGGPGNVNNAIRKSGSRNFWNLQYYLPAESRNHVKKFIATHYIMEGNGSVTTLTKSETANLMATAATAPAKTKLMTISGKYNSAVIAQNMQMNLVEFNRLNPAFDKVLAQNGMYNLILPEDKALLFEAARPQILEQSVRLLLQTANR